MTFRLKDPRRRNPKVQAYAGDGVGFAHVSIYTRHASLGFTRGARLDDKDGLFAPSRSATYRVVKLDRPGVVPTSMLVRLIKQSVAIAKEESQ